MRSLETEVQCKKSLSERFYPEWCEAILLIPPRCRDFHLLRFTYAFIKAQVQMAILDHRRGDIDIGGRGLQQRCVSRQNWLFTALQGGILAYIDRCCSALGIAQNTSVAPSALVGVEDDFVVVGTKEWLELPRILLLDR